MRVCSDTAKQSRLSVADLGNGSCAQQAMRVLAVRSKDHQRSAGLAVPSYAMFNMAELGQAGEAMLGHAMLREAKLREAKQA
jgi:hypothetical protein